MPLYTYRCSFCFAEQVNFRSISQRNSYPHCERAHQPPVRMERIVEAPMVRPDYAGYSCPVTGKRIEGRKAHEENLRKQGARVLEPGESAASHAQARASEEALYTRIGETVDRTIAEMPPAKRERLGAEVTTGGLDIQFQRATGKAP